MNNYDVLITNFIDYDMKLESKDSIVYYAIAIKKVNNKYKVIEDGINLNAINLFKHVKEKNILVIENPPLARWIYAMFKPRKKIKGTRCMHTINQIYKSIELNNIKEKPYLKRRIIKKK